ncbi:MAG TPA: NADH-ubiquinone oxidoreductase-F iron-sulfur binding region domain-containing protein [Pseudonocardiaceae bacterium]|jgi:NADH:ubiquinone oxidoreductase subunit F (NADH-binding)|nr:NADH-ubiquinone oxidoreductase-F iron-sulfur binding region domain-containing protein [Pseudonocardiaceae bacterium]
MTDERLLAGWRHTGRPADLRQHHARYGNLPRIGRAELIDLVEKAGLRGRGGAWFPTGRKLRTVAQARRRPIVLANACEGEPASEKDHALLTIAPHLVLDGIALAAHAVRAEETIICLHTGDPVVAGLRAAIAERADPLPPRVVEVPPRYVASEESALINYVNVGDPRPTSKPPRPFERGVRGRPTLIDNAETLAQLALLARGGANWYRSAGTRDAPGTTLVTVSGAVGEPGVREVPLGTPLGQIVRLAGGETQPWSAVLAGGYGGSWLPWPRAAGLRLTPEDFRAAGARLGVPILVALPARACGLAETARVLRYLAGESANQCGPCMFGLPAIAADFEELVTGVGGHAMNRLRRRLPVIAGRGACAHPDGAVNLAVSALRTFGADVAAHQSGRPCRWAGVDRWLPSHGVLEEVR